MGSNSFVWDCIWVINSELCQGQFVWHWRSATHQVVIKDDFEHIFNTSKAYSKFLHYYYLCYTQKIECSITGPFN